MERDGRMCKTYVWSVNGNGAHGLGSLGGTLALLGLVRVFGDVGRVSGRGVGEARLL